MCTHNGDLCVDGIYSTEELCCAYATFVWYLQIRLCLTFWWEEANQFEKVAVDGFPKGNESLILLVLQLE